MKYDFGLDIETRNSLSLLIKRVRSNSTVLEFGPAHGRMTRYLKKNLNCKVYAVEIDSGAAKDAKQYAEDIIVGSIENYFWKEKYANIKFDYIVFADVLEHLYNPEKVLYSVKELLKPEGSILISLPNIAHNSIIISLLRNDFSYRKTGLLDETHIRFFTKNTFDALIERNGYNIAYESAVFMEPKDTEFFNDYSDVPLEIGKYLKERTLGEIYQLIYEIKKCSTDLVSELDIVSKEYNKHYAQLYYIEENENFLEEKSIRFFLNSDLKTQTYEFDIIDKSIKKLRLDPLNDLCVVEIKSIELVKEECIVNILPFVSTNACMENGTTFFFDSDDSQIYFEQLNEDMLNKVIKLKVSVKIKCFSEDALHECYKVKSYLLEKTRNEATVWHKELESIYNSRSWKVIKKLNKLFKIFKKQV